MRLFFATDIHGSEQCFRKWLNAAGAYKAEILVLGGDMTGKVLLPLVADGEGWRGEMGGETVYVRDEDELDELRRRLRVMGRYEVFVTGEQADLLGDPSFIEEAFLSVARERLADWVRLADERLAGSGVSAFVMLGNDDPPEFADVLRTSEALTYAEDGVCALPSGHELVSFGYSNPTPWRTPREVSEEEIGTRLDALAGMVDDPSRAIFNVHPPPYGTHLDQAALLDETLRPVAGAAGIEMTSVGSHALRAAVEQHQPLLGLHGHVHESPSAERIGRTLCINPGSDYASGVLRGTIVTLAQEAEVRGWQLTTG